MNNYLTLGLSTTLVSLSVGLSSCSQYDPIYEKERAIAAARINKPEPTTPTTPTNPTPPQPTDPTPTTPPTPIRPKPEPPKTILVESLYSFEYWATVGAKALHSRPLLSPSENVERSYWVSASNEGYTRVPGSKTPEMFPVRKLEQGYKGAGVSLRSVEGFYLFGLGTKLVAGSLYSGSVNSNTLASRPLESTLFGHAWSDGIPTELKLHYQYKSGAKVIHGQNKALPKDLPQHDQGSISAVLYETTHNPAPLNGTNVATDARIVARAYKLIDPSSPLNTWQELSLAFEVKNQEAYDSIDMSQKKYALAIIFSSSARGDQYIGAIGSELLIDEVKLISKK